MIQDRPELSLDTVLFATDFSSASVLAGIYASALSRFFSAELIVAHAFTISQAAMEVEASGRAVSRQRKDLQERLDLTAGELPGGRGKVRRLLVDGDPVEAIPRLADANAPGIVVLGTHGGNTLERHLLGSTAQGILRRSKWPVLTVGPRVTFPGADGLSFSRILYTTDSSFEAAHAAPVAVGLAESFGTKIDVLNVVREDAAEDPDGLEDLRRKLYDELEGIVHAQARDFCDPRTFVRVGDARRQILNHVQEREINLLVLGVKRDGYLGMLARTSEAFHIIVEAPCPVLTLADA